MTRKYLYLVTEHDEQPALVGAVQMSDTRFDRPEKNKEGPYQIFNEDSGEFRTVGKKVGVGYHDFEDGELDDNDRVAAVLQEKLSEIDEKWLDKAGVEL